MTPDRCTSGVPPVNRPVLDLFATASGVYPIWREKGRWHAPKDSGITDEDGVVKPDVAGYRFLGRLDP